MDKKIEPLPRSIIENMIAAGQIYWRKPLPLIPRKWRRIIAVGLVVIIVVGVIAFPS